MKVKKDYFRYVRDKHGNGLGAVVVRELEHGLFQIGVSICNPKDKFSKDEARKVATQNVEKAYVYDFYSMIDGDWYADIMDRLPNGRSTLENDIYSTIDAIAHDIAFDYARSYYKSIA